MAEIRKGTKTPERIALPMYNPNFRVNKSGIPILSKQEIDVIGERLVQDFCPVAMQTPAEIDIDSFVLNYLGMTQDFQYLSHNGVYLGMTVFNDTDSVVVFNPESFSAEYISAKARTVIIDTDLLAENQERRYRFTMGHEGSHDILHSQHYAYDPNQVSLFGESVGPLIQCRRDSGRVPQKPISQWTDKDRMEWQANRLSSAILMPKKMVLQLVSGISISDMAIREATSVERVSKTFNVSLEAALYRLKDLGLASKNLTVHKVGAVLDFMDLPF
jgi:Zn-dependent peptidase ImmA (M78 family)